MTRLTTSVVLAAVAPAAIALAGAGAAPASAGPTTLDGKGTILVDGVKTFPIALSRPPALDARTPWGTDAVSEVTRAGVTLLRVDPLNARWSREAIADARAWNAAAAARGVHTWTNLRELTTAFPETPEDALLREVVTALKDDPGLGMWRGADEPWWVGTGPERLHHPYATAKAIDPRHLWVTIQAPRGNPWDLAPYSAVTDLHGVDIYPVDYRFPDPRLHEVGRWTRTIRSVTPNEAVFMTLQICFSGSDDPAGSGAYVMPTRRQERYMVYDAIINGARALNFFGGHYRECLSGADVEAGWNWTFWTTVLKGLIREIGPRSSLYPALLAPGTDLPVWASDRTTQLRSRQVGRRDVWVIAARHGAGTRRVTIRGLPRGIRGGTVYTEGRRIAVKKGAFTDTFGRWAVHVYRFRR
jgi:hypothetical protein